MAPAPPLISRFTWPPQDGHTSRASSDIFWRFSNRVSHESHEYSYAGIRRFLQKYGGIPIIRKPRSQTPWSHSQTDMRMAAACRRMFCDELRRITLDYKTTAVV